MQSLCFLPFIKFALLNISKGYVFKKFLSDHFMPIIKSNHYCIM